MELEDIKQVEIANIVGISGANARIIKKQQNQFNEVIQNIESITLQLCDN